MRDVFPQRDVNSRTRGPAVTSAGDGLEGVYSGVLHTVPTAGACKVLIPAFSLTSYYTAKCPTVFSGAIGDAVLVAFDEQKQPWLITPSAMSAAFMLAPAGTMVSRTRVMGTVYQPNTSRPTFVTTTITLTVTASNAICEIRMDAVNPPVTVIARPVLLSAGASQVETLVPVSFVVPTGFFYELVSVGATAATVDRTFEYTL